MALTRKFLSALGIEAEKIDEIISAHTETVDALKAERDEFKAQASRTTELEKKVKDLEDAQNDSKKDSWKLKYEAMKEDFEEYKNGIEKEKTTAKKESAYKKLLKEAGIPEKRLDAILKITDLSSIEFDEDGKLKEADKISASIKEEWSDFIPTKQTEGAKTSNPPANGGKATKTKEEIRAISDPVERQKAMMENPSLFGLPDNSNNE